MLVSIFLATCRTQNILGFLDNLKQTANDFSCFEVLIKLDEGATELINLVSEYAKNSVYKIKYIVSAKLDGYYTLNVGYNELLSLTDPTTYFCWLLTDEIRLETKGWDSILQRYVKFYPDDIFRLKLSVFQNKNYYDLYECLTSPDNYAVTTRKWLEVTGGWGDFWGPDSWHECIDYYLGRCKNPKEPCGVWRSIPIYEIKIIGQEAGIGVPDRQSLRIRTKRIVDGWNQHSSHHAQINYNRLAHRLNAHIVATQNNLNSYQIIEKTFTKSLRLCDVNGKTIAKWRYSVPRFRLKLMIGQKHMSLHVILFRFRVYRMIRNRIGKLLNNMHGISLSNSGK